MSMIYEPFISLCAVLKEQALGDGTPHPPTMSSEPPPSLLVPTTPPQAVFPPPASKAWRPWSVPLDATRMARELCGLLNKVTQATLDSIADRVARWAVAVEAAGNNGGLDTFVHALFARGVRDPARAALWVALCVRVVDELEGERNAWKRVELYHVGNPLRSFETVVRLIPNAEFQHALARGDAEGVYALLSFTGELLVQGILYIEDTQDIVNVLFNRAYRNDDVCTIALARFVRPVLKAFNAINLLGSLEVAKGIEHALQSPELSSMVRCILLVSVIVPTAFRIFFCRLTCPKTLLDQVSYPQPPDAFNSSRERIEAYGIEPDSDNESAMDTDEVDMDRLLRSCRERAAIFFAKRSHAYAQRALQDLLPEHRHYFFQELISDVVQRRDGDDARLVGALWLLEDTHQLCQEDHAFLRGLEAELCALQDTIVDVPDACHTIAAILHETPLDVQVLESLVWQAVPAEGGLREKLLGELSTQERFERSDDVEAELRRNRFERTAKHFSSPGPSSGAYAY